MTKPYIYTKPPTGSLVDPEEPINDGLVAWWIANEGLGSHLNDISGNENHGTLQSTTGWDGGNLGRTMTFNGVDSTVNFGNVLSIGTSDWSVTLFVNVPSTEVDDGGLVTKGATSVGSSGWELSYISANDYLRFGISTGVARVQSRSNFNIGIIGAGWKHCAVSVQRNSLCRFYLDGQAVGAYDVSSVSANADSSTNLLFGKWVGFTPFDGKLDNVKIWNRALTAEEVMQEYTMPFKGIK